MFRNTTTKICHQSGCQESLKGWVYDRKICDNKNSILLQITHKVRVLLRNKGHTRGISGSIKRKTGSLRPMSSLKDSISLQNLL